MVGLQEVQATVVSEQEASTTSKEVLVSQHGHVGFHVQRWYMGSLLKSEFRYFEKRLHSLYRGLARGDIPEVVLRLWSNERVRAFVQLPSAQEILHGARLRYSVSLYSSGPPTL